MMQILCVAQRNDGVKKKKKKKKRVTLFESLETKRNEMQHCCPPFPLFHLAEQCGYDKGHGVARLLTTEERVGEIEPT